MGYGMHREFAEKTFKDAKETAVNLDTGSWNVGNVVDKKDRQALLSYASTYKPCH